MAVNTDADVNGCTFQWEIENQIHWWMKTGERIESPSFIADALEGTKWSLWLYPRGKSQGSFVGVDLYREKDCNGPNEIVVSLQIAILDKNGIFLKDLFSNKCYTKGARISYMPREREKVFDCSKESLPPNDILTVQCTIWKNGETPVNSKNLFARTSFKVNSKTFILKIDGFSTLQLGIRNKFKDDLMNFELVLKEGLDCEKHLVIDGISFDCSIKYFLFNIAVINSEGKNKYCVSQKYFADDLKKGILSTLLSTKMLEENKSRYLPNDTLTLDCEYLYSTGTVSYEFCSYGTISPKLTKAVVEEKSEQCFEQPNIQLVPVLVNDLKSMYNDGIFSDMELRTSTKNFPAHKNILGARSSVFRRMFSNDMLEKNCGYIDIADLEADTVHRMLLYIYTDSLEDLQLENASKLYVAADKYDLVTLRSRCSFFLKDNLSPTNACDVLALADRHQDDELKNAVMDFILSHDKEVFNSQEWKHFMTTNLQLAADVMYRKVSLG